MEGNARAWFTPKQRAELWERWKRGQCVVAHGCKDLARDGQSSSHRYPSERRYRQRSNCSEPHHLEFELIQKSCFLAGP